MSFINATPHDIVVLNDDGENHVTIPTSGIEIRVEETRVGADIAFIEGEMIPVDELAGGKLITRTPEGSIAGLPYEEEGVVYIVSRPVAAHPDAGDRDDLLIVNEQVRDAKNQIIGCRSLARYI